MHSCTEDGQGLWVVMGLVLGDMVQPWAGSSPKFSGTITIEDDSAVEAGSLRFI